MSRALVSLICIFALNARADWVGWHPNAWTNYRSATETVTVFATAHSYVLTNYFGTNSPVVTNAFLSNIYAASNGTSIVSTFAFTLTQSNGVVWTKSITTTNWHGATNLVFSNREIMQYDVFRAVQERILAIGYSQNSARFYRDAYDNLVSAKDVIDSSDWWLGNTNAMWISRKAFSNELAATPVSLRAISGNYVFDVPETNNLANWAVAASVPSNFFTSTFFRDIFGTNAPYLNVMTCSYVIATSSTNIITNAVSTCCGGGAFISGTNRQTILVVCTNSTIEYGHNSASYGYQAMRRMLTNLTAAVYPKNDQTELWFGGNANFPFRDVQPVATSISQAYTQLANGSLGSFNYATHTFAEDTFGESRASARHGINVYVFYKPEISASIDFYMNVSPAFPGSGYTLVFDDYGTGFIESTNSIIWKTFPSGPLYTNETTVSATSVVTIATWANTNSVRGHQVNDAMPVAWFNFTYK